MKLTKEERRKVKLYIYWNILIAFVISLWAFFIGMLWLDIAGVALLVWYIWRTWWE